MHSRIMAFSQRTLPVLFIAAALVVGLAACSGNSTAGAGGGAGSGSKSGGGSGTTSSSSATFSGSESGTATESSCTSGPGMGIYVVVKGSTDKLPGAISKSTMDFNGSDSIYTIDKTGPLPKFASDGNSVKLDGVKLKSVIDSSKEVTFSGTLTCP
jgi:hypothetical protein